MCPPSEQPAHPRILLVRHGRPAAWRRQKPLHWIPGRGVRAFLDSYRASGLDEISAPPARLRDRIGSPAVVFTSGLPRAAESAAALGLATTVADAVFEEAGLPSGIGRWVWLPIGAWLLVLRVIWLLGLSARDCETVGDARARARAGARILDGRARHDGEVILIGHGFMNILIHRELARGGWRRMTRFRGGHWASIELRLGSG